MTSVLGVVRALFRTAIHSSFPRCQVGKALVQKSDRLGDYQCNAAMPIAQVCVDGSADRWNFKIRMKTARRSLLHFIYEGF